MVRTVSQPRVSSQEITAGSRLPRTPNAARDSTIVGAEPRLPASATNPHSRNENDDADEAGDRRLPERDAEPERERAVGEAQHRDVGAEPRPEQLAGPAAALGVDDHVDAVGLDAQATAARPAQSRPLPGGHRRRGARSPTQPPRRARPGCPGGSSVVSSATSGNASRRWAGCPHSVSHERMHVQSRRVICAINAFIRMAGSARGVAHVDVSGVRTGLREPQPDPCLRTARRPRPALRRVRAAGAGVLRRGCWRPPAGRGRSRCSPSGRGSRSRCG